VAEADVQRMVAVFKEISNKLSRRDMGKMNSVPYAMLDEDDFEKVVLIDPNNVEIHGLITESRIDIVTIPEDTYAYYMRNLGYKDTVMTIERGNVKVNFGGTFLCKEQIDFDCKGYIDIISDKTEWCMRKEYM
jgi:hypothetical protein